MLCGDNHIISSVFYLVFLEILFLHENFQLQVYAALPPGAEDEIVVIEHLPGRRVHLQDFFWTRAEDAPPWMDPEQGLTFYHTRTIHHTATVYLPDGTREEEGDTGNKVAPYDPECINCIEPTPTFGSEEGDIGVLIGEDPGPRYWLLTVLRAGESVPPKVELRLARLYRAAFSRQQERHLGILSPELSGRGSKKRRVLRDHPNPWNNRWNKNESSIQAFQKINTGSTLNTKNGTDNISIADNTRNIFNKNISEELGDIFNRNLSEFVTRRNVSNSNTSKNTKEIHDSFGKNNEYISEEIIRNVSGRNNLDNVQNVQTSSNYRNRSVENVNNLSDESERVRNTSNRNKQNNDKEKKETLVPNNRSRFDETRSNRAFRPNDEKVKRMRSVRITRKSRTLVDLVREDPQRNGEILENDENVNASFDNSTSLLLSSFPSEKLGRDDLPLKSQRTAIKSLDIGTVRVRMQNTTVLDTGATRLIYSVHLGGKPVPAEIAARDMSLLSEQEVALELGAPVIIQSEPYLKETQPLALSRRRDAWLLIGAAGAAIILLAFIFTGLIILAKRKRAHSAVSVPPTQSILRKDIRDYTPTTIGLDNTGYTTETEGKTDRTSQRQTPATLSRTPATRSTADSLDDNVQELSSDEELRRNVRTSTPWNESEAPPAIQKTSNFKNGRRRVLREDALDCISSPGSIDLDEDNLETLESLEKGYDVPRDVNASPHSYLSMPSCKQFPSMRSVEPLCRILEPIVVRHLDVELDSPRDKRQESDHFSTIDTSDKFLLRTSSASKDPGVVGPIVWNLRRQKVVEGTTTSETDGESTTVGIGGPVGRARKRLNELLEDSFSLFGSKDSKMKEPSEYNSSNGANAGLTSTEYTKVLSETRGKSANVSPVATPAPDIRRPRTSLPRKEVEERTLPTEATIGRHPRGAWGSRPLSAGPFHRPNLPEVDTVRVLADSFLTPEDPAVPLIAAIKKELEKFSPERKT